MSPPNFIQYTTQQGATRFVNAALIEDCGALDMPLLIPGRTHENVIGTEILTASGRTILALEPVHLFSGHRPAKAENPKALAERLG